MPDFKMIAICEQKEAAYMFEKGVKFVLPIQAPFRIPVEQLPQDHFNRNILQHSWNRRRHIAQQPYGHYLRLR